MRTLPTSGALVLFLAALSDPASSQDDSDFDLGLRFDVLAGDGEPTNDVLGYGVFGHVPLDERWRISFAVDHSPEFDVERTAEIVGFEQSGSEEDEIDSKASSTTLTAWLERGYGDRLEWVWGIGAGVADVEVDTLEGTRPGGEPFRVETDAGTELLLIGNAGLRWWLGAGRWALSTELRLEQHFSDWTLREARSGQEVTVDDYLLTGIHFGLVRRF